MRWVYDLLPRCPTILRATFYATITLIQKYTFCKLYYFYCVTPVQSVFIYRWLFATECVSVSFWSYSLSSTSSSPFLNKEEVAWKRRSRSSNFAQSGVCLVIMHRFILPVWKTKGSSSLLGNNQSYNIL